MKKIRVSPEAGTLLCRHRLSHFKSHWLIVLGQNKMIIQSKNEQKQSTFLLNVTTAKQASLKTTRQDCATGKSCEPFI